MQLLKQLCKWISTQSVIKSVNLNKYKLHDQNISDVIDWIKTSTILVN